MSKRQKLNLSGGYDVGYKKPPEAGRFSKGQSGNPKGRPKGSKNKKDQDLPEFIETILQEAERLVPVGDRAEQISLREAVVRAIALKAVKGNTAAQRHFAQLLDYAEDVRDTPADEDAADDLLAAGIALKTQAMLAETALAQNGTPFPDWLPRPDDIVLDYKERDVYFRRPLDVRGRRQQAWCWRMRHLMECEIAFLDQSMRDQLCKYHHPRLTQMQAILKAACDQLKEVMYERWRIERTEPVPEEIACTPADQKKDQNEDQNFEPDAARRKTLEQFFALRRMRQAMEIAAGRCTQENAPLQDELSRTVKSGG